MHKEFSGLKSLFNLLKKKDNRFRVKIHEKPRHKAISARTPPDYRELRKCGNMRENIENTCGGGIYYALEWPYKCAGQLPGSSRTGIRPPACDKSKSLSVPMKGF
jgi:hypothetical protein